MDKKKLEKNKKLLCSILQYNGQFFLEFLFSFSFSFLFRYSIIVNVFDEMGFTWNLALPISSFFFLFSLKNLSILIFPPFSKKLIYFYLDKSLMKSDTLYCHLTSSIYPDGHSQKPN